MDAALTTIWERAVKANLGSDSVAVPFEIDWEGMREKLALGLWDTGLARLLSWQKSTLKRQQESDESGQDDEPPKKQPKG